jgi:hypothetical protein
MDLKRSPEVNLIHTEAQNSLKQFLKSYRFPRLGVKTDESFPPI